MSHPLLCAWRATPHGWRALAPAPARHVSSSRRTLPTCRNIAKKYAKINEVQKQLADLQIALHVNVGPRRQVPDLAARSAHIPVACCGYIAKASWKHWFKLCHVC